MRSDIDIRRDVEDKSLCGRGVGEHCQSGTETSRQCEAITTFVPAGAVDRRAMIAPGMAAEVVHGTAHGRIVSNVQGQRHTLIVYHRGSRRNCEPALGGLPRPSINHFAHKLVFVPAGHEFRNWHDVGTDLSALIFYFDPAKLRECLGMKTTDGGLALRLFFEDPTLWATGIKMESIIVSALDDRRYFEALGLVLIHEIACLKSRPPKCGGLASWQQRAVGRYIDEHLSDPISLATLAALVRLSRYYFCRAFTRSFGVPPHRYLVDCRVDRAKQLLVERNRSISDIALEVGYSDISAFSCAFRKVTGLTASFYRRQIEQPLTPSSGNKDVWSGKSWRQVTAPPRATGVISKMPLTK